MPFSDTSRAIWNDIERSESYLVSCMYEEAASLASSALRDIRPRHNSFVEAGEEAQFNDILESSGMVLVQSLKELGRTQAILNELSMLFGSVTSIPIEVLLTGVCFQIKDGPCLGTREFLEEFLSKWRFMDGRFYVLSGAESDVHYTEGSGGHFVLAVDKYLEVAEIYAVSLLGMVSGELSHAISWVEKAELPEEKQQDLLRKLHSLYSSKALESSEIVVPLPANEDETRSSSLKEKNVSEGSPEISKSSYKFKGKNEMKQTVLKLSQQKFPCLWWFRTFTLKYGNHQLVISNGKIVLSCLIILLYYVFQRKQAMLKRILRRRALSMKKALVDFWQLAFSYQVNPLAAVQPVPSANRLRQ
ncbi:protein APEM9 isoform X2 [Diospyros lotus]|uniref:protein APEM9 isoform X2 n=1 Tax=Diospyros lotus TaxID=55363 RepID=UPI00225B40E6|nr:protein APEM9 isoform X2 [Diospyros lotus]